MELTEIIQDIEAMKAAISGGCGFLYGSYHGWFSMDYAPPFYKKARVITRNLIGLCVAMESTDLAGTLASNTVEALSYLASYHAGYEAGVRIARRFKTDG